jgi:hypothetical protein
MTRKIILLGIAATAAMAQPVYAGGNAHSGATVGDCISDGFYGNEPNMADGTAGGPAEQAHGANAGNVVPSQSPGPKVINPDGTVRDGASVGDINREFGGGALNEFCRTTTAL